MTMWAPRIPDRLVKGMQNSSPIQFTTCEEPRIKLDHCLPGGGLAVGGETLMLRLCKRSDIKHHTNEVTCHLPDEFPASSSARGMYSGDLGCCETYACESTPSKVIHGFVQCPASGVLARCLTHPLGASICGVIMIMLHRRLRDF